MTRKLAIISPNRSKYSETFIQAQIEYLPFDKLLLTEGIMPTLYSTDNGETMAPISAKKKWWQATDPKKALTKFLIGQNVDVVLAQYGVTGVEVMQSCLMAGIPLIVHFHGYDAYRDDVMRNQGKSYPDLFKLAAGIIIVSRDMYQQLLSLGCPENKLRLLPYGVDSDFFIQHDSVGSTFVTCGRFVAKKSPLNTIHAFAKVHEQFPEARLTMIGDGELLEAAKELVISLNLSGRVNFAGVLSQGEISAVFGRAFAFVQHSLRAADNDSEGTPLAILEAMSSGLPVVATRHAGIIDVVDETTGILVEEGDVEAMADAMIHLLKKREWAASLGENGRKRIEKQYTRKQYLEALQIFINDCCIEKQ